VKKTDGRTRTRALFGGSFDPPTHAHIGIGRALAARFDEVIVLPARVSPFKQAVVPAPPAWRLAMLTAAFSACPNITVSDFELGLTGVSYSYLTARAFSAPGIDLYFAVGSDGAASFDRWARTDLLRELVTFYIIPRPGYPMTDGTLEAANRVVRAVKADFTGGEGSSTLFRVANAFGLGREVSPAFIADAARAAGLYGEYGAIVGRFKEFGLSDTRIRHIYGTAKAAVALAGRFGAGQDAAARAALLHDIGKNTEPNAFCTPAEAAELEKQPPACRHAPLSAYIAKRAFGETDADVLAAIETHTVGAPEMSTLQKIVFIADYIEEGRHFSGVERVRAAAQTDLDSAVLACYEETFSYLKKTDREISPQSFDAYRHYQVKFTKQ
jgi:nicotinate-nucleotide adenylyltransferase